MSECVVTNNTIDTV